MTRLEATWLAMAWALMLSVAGGLVWLLRWLAT